MWQRFTEWGRRVIFYAQEEAARLGENYVSTEHILLGMTRGGETINVACRVLECLNVSPAKVQEEILRQVARGDGRTAQDMQLTPRAKRVIDLAYDEARELNNNYIGTEHLLLGLLREGEGLAGRVLGKLGVTLETARAIVVHLQKEADNNADEATTNPATTRSGENITIKPGERLDGHHFAGRVRAALGELRRTDPQLFLLDQNALLTEKVAARLQGEKTEVPIPGDLGTAQALEGRNSVEIAHDTDTFHTLVAVFQAKDRHGYRQLAHGDQTLFLVPNGTPLKLLINSDRNVTLLGGVRVRVLGGTYEGYAGWMFADSFRWEGRDDAPFLPEENSLDVEKQEEMEL